MILTALLAACDDPQVFVPPAFILPPSDTGAGVTDDHDLACDARVNRSISLVIDVSWIAPEGATSYVQYGETEVYDQHTPVTSDSTVALNLLGNGPDRDIYWRGASELDDVWSTCTGVTHTGTAPANLPQVTVTTNEPEAQDAAEFILGAYYSGSSSQAQLAAYRRDGTVVWYWEGSDGGSTLDVHADPVSGGLYYNVFPNGELGAEEASLHLISRAGVPLGEWSAPYAHHMFAPMADGAVILQRTDTRDFTNPRTGLVESWVGDRLTELTPDGALTDTFSTWGPVPPRENVSMDVLNLYPGRDWTHGNMVRCDESAGTCTLSLGHAQDVLTIERTTGRVLEIVGVDGLHADPVFDLNHDPHWIDPDHLQMFMTSEHEAGAIEYERTETGFTEAWRCGFDAPPFALGQAEPLPNGNTLINFGTHNRLVEVTPACEAVWQVEGNNQLGGPVFGQFHLVNDLYSGPY